MFAILLLFTFSAASLFVPPGASIQTTIHSLRGKVGPRELVLGNGVHRLSAPLLLTGADSGITVRGEGAVVDGGVSLNFSVFSDQLWSAPLPAALKSAKAELSQLIVNGVRRLRAREPNALGAPPWSPSALFSDAVTFKMAGPAERCSLPCWGSCPDGHWQGPLRIHLPMGHKTPSQQANQQSILLGHPMLPESFLETTFRHWVCQQWCQMTPREYPSQGVPA